MDLFKDIIERGESYYAANGRRKNGPDGKFSGAMIWDHALRVWKLAQWIGGESGISLTKAERPLAAAALFHDAGWIEQVSRGTCEPIEVFSRPADAELRRFSQQAASEQLRGVLSEGELGQACRWVAQLPPSRPADDAARILADADNLEEMGLVGLLRQVRCGLINGRCPDHLVEVWRRQQEYHYWEARIKTGFHLEASRRLALKRLERMGRFFDALGGELDGSDARELSGTPAALSSKPIGTGGV